MIPSKPKGKGTPVAGKAAPARSAKQVRKDNLRKALAAIKNKVPKEGRSVFEGGADLSDTEIEPFERHDALMRKAGKKMIFIILPKVPTLEDLVQVPVVETWK
jgi:hypothetical protein